MPEAPEASERPEAPLEGPVQNRGRAATLSLVLLLLASMGGAVFAACAVWQAGAIVQALLEMTERAPAAAARPPLGDEELGDEEPARCACRERWVIRSPRAAGTSGARASRGAPGSGGAASNSRMDSVPPRMRAAIVPIARPP